MTDMYLKGKVALFPECGTTADIIDVATGQLVLQHDVQGMIWRSAFVQKNIAAITVSEPYHGVHVMDVKSGKVFFKFMLPDGRHATVALSKDTLTLTVGSSTGM